MKRKLWTMVLSVPCAIVTLSCSSATVDLGARNTDAGDAAEPRDGAAPIDDAGVAERSTRAVYAAHAGVSAPWFVSVGPRGASAPIRLGPVRGAGYGLGEGSVSYPDLTPDDRVVVVFSPLEGESTLFALSLGGGNADAPVAVARVRALSVRDRAYHDGWIAYVDDGDLYAAPLDGSGLDHPRLIARAGPGREIERPRWVPGTGRIAFNSKRRIDTYPRAVMSARVDGSEAGAPVDLSNQAAPKESIAGVLPDGRLVVYGTDDRLYAVSVEGGSRLALTPGGPLVSYLGASEDGSRIAVELRYTWREARELISVATDGSEAALPVLLTPEPVAGLGAVLSRDGARIAWSAEDDAGDRWAVFESSVAEPARPSQVTAWSPQRIHLTDYDSDLGALIGSSEDGAVLRIDLSERPGSVPDVLFVVENVVNHGYPWPRLSVDGSHVIFDANTPQGFRAWIVSLSGGPASEVPPPWYRDLLDARGVLVEVSHELTAAFASDLRGNVEPITPWFEGRLSSAFLAETRDASWLVYAKEGPDPGWYSARVAPGAPPREPGLIMPAGGEAPIVASGRLIRLVSGALLSHSIAPGEPVATLIASGAAPPIAVHEPSGRVVAVQDRRIVSVDVEGLWAPEALLEAPGEVVALICIPSSDRILAGFHEPGTGLSLATAVVGGPDPSPRIVARGLPGWPMALGLAGRHVLSVHSIEATAVPHPDLLLTTALSESGGPIGAELAPRGYSLWAASPQFEGFGPSPLSGPFATPDGAHAILIGPRGLYSARTDGSEATAPVYLGPATDAIGPPIGPPFGADGRTVLAAGRDEHERPALYIARAGEHGSGRLVTTFESAPAEGFWSGERIVVRAGDEIHVVEAGGAALRGLLSGGTIRAEELLALTPDGSGAVFAGHTQDRSLYVVPLDGSTPAVSLSPVDDAEERLIGFLHDE